MSQHEHELDSDGQDECHLEGFAVIMIVITIAVVVSIPVILIIICCMRSQYQKLQNYKNQDNPMDYFNTASLVAFATLTFLEIVLEERT